VQFDLQFAEDGAGIKAPHTMGVEGQLMCHTVPQFQEELFLWRKTLQQRVIRK